VNENKLDVGVNSLDLYVNLMDLNTGEVQETKKFDDDLLEEIGNFSKVVEEYKVNRRNPIIVKRKPSEAANKNLKFHVKFKRFLMPEVFRKRQYLKRSPRKVGPRKVGRGQAKRH
jgi:hypothetical protein